LHTQDNPPIAAVSIKAVLALSGAVPPGGGAVDAKEVCAAIPSAIRIKTGINFLINFILLDCLNTHRSYLKTGLDRSVAIDMPQYVMFNNCI
jgi:hypothetical protein